MPDTNPSNLAWLSRVMAWLATAGAIIAPIVVVYSYLFPESAKGMNFSIDQTGELLSSTVPLAYRAAAMLFSLFAEGFTIWALWALRALFLGYARGEVFTQRALSLINTVGVALFAGVIVTFVVHAPISLLLSWPKGPHHRLISLGIGSNDISTLFSAGVVLVIARVMVRARGLADENAKFV